MENREWLSFSLRSWNMLESPPYVTIQFCGNIGPRRRRWLRVKRTFDGCQQIETFCRRFAYNPREPAWRVQCPGRRKAGRGTLHAVPRLALLAAGALDSTLELQSGGTP